MYSIIKFLVIFMLLALSPLLAFDSNVGQTVNVKKTKDITVIVQLSSGIFPLSSYQNMLQASTMSKKDIQLVKSFPLIEKAKKPSITNDKKHILILKSNSLSKNDLLQYAKSLPGAEIVELSSPITINAQNIPNDPSFYNLWGMSNIKAPQAWDIHQGNNNAIVGVIDTGIDYNHPDLYNNIWTNSVEASGTPGIDDDNNGYIDDIHGIDTYNNDSDPMDDNKHGTHVSGTIGAVGNNQKGVVGVNWHTQIASCKFLGADGSGDLAGALECINYFNALKRDHGVNIVVTNNSWGGGPFSQLMANAIQTANDLNINFVAAAGNDANNNDISPSYPSGYLIPNVISVAAIDINNNLASFSNYGATSVDIAAPGVDILSTVPGTSTCQLDGINTLFSDSFETGTSNWSFFTEDTNNPGVDIPNEHWIIDNTQANSGTHSLSDSLNNDYTNNRKQNMTMLNGLNLATLSGNTFCVTFMLKGETETHYDFLKVYASGDNGATWTLIGSKDGAIANWTNISFKVPDVLANSTTFKIKIERVNDSSITKVGYNIDDVKIGTGTYVNLGNYENLSGTSMASPHVSGALTLLASLNPNMNAQQRKDSILNNSDKLPNLSGKILTSGKLNLLNSIVSNYTVESTKDFNADGISDILWRYQDTNIIWYMNADSTSHKQAIDPIWHPFNIAATDDFNADGVTDILWRLNGTNIIWYMNANGTHYQQTIDPMWFEFKAVASADFNADGIADILWRFNDANIIWYMNANGTHYQQAIDTMWFPFNIVSTKDFNGDGISDIFWRLNGTNIIWYMNANGTHYQQTIDPMWFEFKAVASADFNADGIADILWRFNDANIIWYMNANGTHYQQAIDPLWFLFNVEGTGDYNADGVSDILWKYQNINLIWYMNVNGTHTQVIL